ncbi:MAG TPA: hypothetical protein VM537_21820, partial [Anaerolineae bacterium]|nr:hypothetical protein [Anaerolineae bacterium]
LRRQVDAVSKTLLSDPREPALRLRPVRNETDRAERNDLIEIERIEYVFGAREIQANDVNYNQVGAYASPQFSPASTVLQLQLDAVEEHPTFGTGAATYRQTSIEYDLEVAPGRRRAILPKGSTVVQDELLVLDQSTRQDTTRFKATGATGTLRKNGESVDPTMFTQVLLPDERIRVTISAAIFSQVARFSLTYTPKADQDKLDVEAEFDSVGLERPETFNGTNDRGEIELQFYPYVDYSIINDADAMNATPNFRREAERSADYFWVGGAEQVILDGRMFGAVNTALTNAITAADTTIGLNSTAAIPSAGSLKIGTELVTYTGKTATDITGVTRGTGGTTAQAHVVGLLIVAEQTYAPLVVNVGNIAAFNISDYLSGRHPAFLSTSEDALRYEYIQIGRKLFFNRPINNTPITVSYRWMTQYLQVFGLLRGHGAARVPSTPVLSRYHLEIESTVL